MIRVPLEDSLEDSQKVTDRYKPNKNEIVCPHKNLNMNFIAELFIITKKWKQMESQSTDEWINEIW